MPSDKGKKPTVTKGEVTKMPSDKDKKPTVTKGERNLKSKSDQAKDPETGTVTKNAKPISVSSKLPAKTIVSWDNLMEHETEVLKQIPEQILDKIFFKVFFC